MLVGMMRWGTDAAQKGLDDRYFSSPHPMMFWMGNNSSVFWFFGILWLVTWALVIIVLIALIRWLWKKGNDEESRRQRR